jgi:hypothetical protein
MPKVSWSAFIERHPAAHLIAGVVLEGDPITGNARWACGLLAKLIGRLAPKDVYAIAVDRHGRTPEIHSVFATEADARKLANAVRADRAGRYPGWASQRTFTLDAEACRAIAAALKTDK